MSKSRSRSVPTTSDSSKSSKIPVQRGEPVLLNQKGRQPEQFRELQASEHRVSHGEDGKDQVSFDNLLHERTRRYHTELLQCKNELDNLTLKVDYLQDTVCLYRDQLVPSLKRKLLEVEGQLDNERTRRRELEKGMYGAFANVNEGNMQERSSYRGEEENLLELKTKMRSELLQLRALFVEEVDRLRTKQAHQLQKLRQEHHIEICGMQLLHQEELKVQDEEHKKEIHKVVKEKKRELKKEAKKRKKEMDEIETYLDGLKREKKQWETEAHILQLHKWNTSRSPRSGPVQPPPWIVPLDVSELPQPILYDDKRIPLYGEHRALTESEPRINILNGGSNFFQSTESAISTPPFAQVPPYKMQYPHAGLPTSNLHRSTSPQQPPPVISPMLQSGGGTTFQQLMAQIAPSGQPNPPLAKNSHTREFRAHAGVAFGPAAVNPQCAAQIQQNTRSQWLHSLPAYEPEVKEAKIGQPSPTRAYESTDDR